MLRHQARDPRGVPAGVLETRSTMSIAAGILFVLVTIPLTLSTALGLPGTWLVIAVAALVDLAELAWRDGGEPIFGIWAFVIAIHIATIAEIVCAGVESVWITTWGATRRSATVSLESQPASE